MNREQLLDAIGKTDESLLRETEQLRIQAMDGNASPAHTTVKTRRPARRKMMILLAACLVLMLGTVAAYATGLIGNRGGTVSTGMDEDGNSTMSFQPNEDMRIPLSEVTGDILNATQYMLANWYRLHDPDNYTPGAEAAENITLSDGLSGFCTIKFRSVQEAVDYIGCDRIIFPSFMQEYTPFDVYVQVIGADTRFPDRPSDPAEVPDFRVSWISLSVGYSIDGITTYLHYYVITEVDEVSRAILYTSVSGGESGSDPIFTSGTVTENDREFQIVYTNHGDANGIDNLDRVDKEYFWAENKVEYHISLFYYDASNTADAADRLIRDWMYSFSD